MFYVETILKGGLKTAIKNLKTKRYTQTYSNYNKTLIIKKKVKIAFLF